MEDGAIEGVLYNTGLMGVNADYVCSAFGITPTISDEEKRDLILPIIQKANPFGDTYDPDTYDKLVSIARSVQEAREKTSNSNIITFEKYVPGEEDESISRAR